jgi:hypothetical protein
MKTTTEWIKEHRRDYGSLSETLAAAKAAPDYHDMQREATRRAETSIIAAKKIKAALRATNRSINRALAA